jgi:hypothetical protein
MICTVWMLGMVAIAPKVGRFSCHCWRRRLSGGRLAGVNCKTPFGWFSAGGLTGYDGVADTRWPDGVAYRMSTRTDSYSQHSLSAQT